MATIKETGECRLCEGQYTMHGHNPEPLLPYHRRCCTTCNDTKVIPARIGAIFMRNGAKGGKAKTKAKVAAAKVNGKKGGRPKAK